MNLLLILILILLIYLFSLSKKEDFIQYKPNKFVCSDKNATNYEIGKNKITDNSYCIYNKDTICNRPFSNNFLDINVVNNYEEDEGSVKIKYNIKNNGVCNDKKYINYVDVYKRDEKGNKIRASEKLAEGNPPSYFNKLVKKDGDYLVDYNNNKIYEQKYKINNKTCLNINNLLCRFPMAKTPVNSLYHIINNYDEYKLLITKDNLLAIDKYVINDKNPEIKKLKENQFLLFKKLFTNTNMYIFNIYDLNGYVSDYQLEYKNKHLKSLNKHGVKYIDNKIVRSNICFSYTDNLGNIKIRKGYDVGQISNYYQLVEKMNNNDLHVALAVSKDASKYAIGIGKTKSIACDIALIRCKINDYFRLPFLFKDHKAELINELQNSANIIEVDNKWWDFFKDPSYEINDLTNAHKINYHNIVNKYIESLDIVTLSVLYYHNLSHNDLFHTLKNLHLSDTEINMVEKKVRQLPSLNTIKKYILHKSEENNKTNPCGILLVDNDRYINYNNDFTNYLNHKDIPDINYSCTTNNCQEIVVLGLDKNRNTHEFKNKSIIPSVPIHDTNKLPYFNEQNEVIKNNLVNIIDEKMDMCKLNDSDCILFKVNNEIYRYNSLYN